MRTVINFISMRTALNNPFQPGSDVVPAVWAGRVNQIGDWRDVLRPRLMAGLFERGRTILGEPGLGKSSLVRRIADDASAQGDWVTPQIRIALGTDPIARLAAELLVLAKKAGLPASREAKIGTLLKRVQTVSAGAAGVSANVTLREGSAEDAHVTLTELLAEIGRAAITQGKVVLIHLDEVQNIDDDNALSQVLVALGDAITRSVTVTVPGVGDVERSLPIAVYLTGLPEFDDASDTRKGATFARRFKVVLLQPLTDDDLRSALSLFISPGWEVPLDEGELGTVHMEPAAIERIISACQGEPFLFQLAGERAWYAGTSSLISEADVEQGWNEATEEARSHVERILSRLPTREREFLVAMADLPPSERTFSKIATAMGHEKEANAGPTSQRLDRVRGIISRGKPYTFRHRALEALLTSEWPEL